MEFLESFVAFTNDGVIEKRDEVFGVKEECMRELYVDESSFDLDGMRKLVGL